MKFCYAPPADVAMASVAGIAPPLARSIKISIDALTALSRLEGPVP